MKLLYQKIKLILSILLMKAKSIYVNRINIIGNEIFSNEDLLEICL